MCRREIAFVSEFWCHSLENYYAWVAKPTLGLLVDQNLIRYTLHCLRNCIKSQEEMATNLMANQFGDQSVFIQNGWFLGRFCRLRLYLYKTQTSLVVLEQKKNASRWTEKGMACCFFFYFLTPLIAYFGIYFVYRTQMTYNKRTKTMKQHQADFSLKRRQKGLLFYVICIRLIHEVLTLGAFHSTKIPVWISEISRARWNGTFRLHRSDPSHRAFGYCSCQDTKERYWGQRFCQMEKGISVRPTKMTRPAKVDHLQSWSRIFRSDQTEMVRSIWCTNRNFRNFGLNGKRPSWLRRTGRSAGISMAPPSF